MVELSLESKARLWQETAYSRILDYVEQRYLERVRAQNIRNFGAVLAKSLLKGVSAQWEPLRIANELTSFCQLH